MKCKAWKIAALLLVLVLNVLPPVLAVEEQEMVGTLPLILRVEGDVSASTGQVSLGGAVADGALLASGADVALIPAEDLQHNLLAGTLTWSEIADAVAAEQLVVVQLTPVQLKAYLEVGLSYLTLDTRTLKINDAASAFAGFPQVAGFSYRGDTSAPVGQRVSRVVLSGGKELDFDDDSSKLTLVTTEAVLSGAYGYPAAQGEAIGVTEQQALADLIRSGVLTESYDGANRLKLIGNSEDSLAGEFHLGILAVIAIAVVVLTGRSSTEFLERIGARWSQSSAPDKLE